MKKVDKTQTIIRAFTTESDIDKDLLKYREKICGGCEFNSENMTEESLGLFSKMRKKTLGESNPFCTACGCQINEKIRQETEECGLVYKGLPPKWNRIKLETIGNSDLDIINKSVYNMNVDLTDDGDNYVLNFGEITNDIHNYNFVITTKDNKELTYVEPGCQSCTRVKFDELTKSSYNVDLTFDATQLFSYGLFEKNVYVGTKIGEETFKYVIKIVGIVKDKENEL